MQLMLDGFGRGQVCEKLNISQPTLWRWMQQPAWATRLEHAVRGEQKEGEFQMRTLVPMATKVVHQLLISGADNIKLGASRLVFETVANLTAREEHQQMLAELEAQVEELRVVATNKLPAAANGAIEVDFVAHAHDPAHSDLKQGGNAQ